MARITKVAVQCFVEVLTGTMSHTHGWVRAWTLLLDVAVLSLALAVGPVRGLSKSATAGNQTIILLGLPLSGHSFVNDALINAGLKVSHNEMNRHTNALCKEWPVPSATVFGPV